MKYFIGSVFLVISLILLTMFGYSLLKTLTDNIYWAFVAVGLAYSTVVSMLATSAAFTAAKQY